ncbi:hypothetical protein J8387_19140, partial [Acinetobacter baumannii]|nr:hypothetical protein [Acinetobacter baumannii]
HAGEGNVMKGKGIGKNNNQYWKDYQSYMAGINGYSAGDISSKVLISLFKIQLKWLRSRQNFAFSWRMRLLIK